MTSALMTQRVVTSTTLDILECGVCTATRVLAQLSSAPRNAASAGQDRRQLCWTPSLADFAVDAATAAIMVGCASEVLLPAGLALFMRTDAAATLSCQAAWQQLLSDRRAVLLATPAELPLLRDPQVTKVCVAVPGGPLCSRMFFGLEQAEFEAVPLAAVADFMCQNSQTSVRAWMRSALGCRYEGPFVPPLRVSEQTARLLQMGFSSVVWEQGPAGLPPRWLETVTKAALAHGVPMESVVPALCMGPDAGNCLDRCRAAGVRHFACSSLTANGGVFERCDDLVSLSTVAHYVVGTNEASDAAATELSDAEEDILDGSELFVQALNAKWRTLKR